MPSTQAQSAGSRSTEVQHWPDLPALGYCRVSTDEQAREGVSLEAQQTRIRAYTTLPARAGGEAAVGLSLIPQLHGGALLSGGKPGNPGHNQHTVRRRAQELRGQLIGQLEGAAKDLAAILEAARESDGDRLRCRKCGSFIPGISKLRLSDVLAVIRELRAVLPAQQEHEGFLRAAHSSPVASHPLSQGGSYR